MAESSTADLMSGTEKENFDRLMSLFRTGTEIKQRLLEYYISKKELNLIDWLFVLSNNFLQFEDVKRAHRRSSTVQSIDLGDNTINTVFMCYCFDIFWDCCLFDTCLEGFLNIHKDELYRSYVNSQKQTELPSVSSAPYSTCSTENSIPIITKDQWEFLYRNDENEKCLLASKGITVSCLDSYQNIFILSIICSLFKALKAVSECQIEISKIAALQCFLTSNKFEEIWTKMKKHVVTIGENCANSDIFQGKCERIRETTYNRSLVQENRKYILQEALNNPHFIRDRDFCECVRKELDLITDEENLNLARKLCGNAISVALNNGNYRKGAYSLSVIENAEKDLQKLTSVCSKPVKSTSQTETEEKTKTDDLQERINKHNYLKLVQLITHIAKNVLVDVVKQRLPATNLGIAFNGMKNRILPLLNTQERQVLYPDNSYYKGDLSDLDISLIYTILRNLNTLRPHKTSWGNMPKDDDRDMSANIERIRFFKNKYVSHHPTYSLNAETFDKTWTEISTCIIELGGTEYSQKIDYLLTSEINPVMEKELFNTLERVKVADREHQIHMNNFKDDLDELKQQLNGITRSCATCNESSGMVPLELKIEGEGTPSVQEIEKRTKTFPSEYALIKSIKEGSIIICLDVASSALSSIGLFLEVIENLLSTVLQRKHKYDDGSTSFVIISLDFMDKNNEPLVYRKNALDMVKLTEEEQFKRPIMNQNSRNDTKDNEQNVHGLRKVTYLKKYGIKSFPYRGSRKYSPCVYQSEDKGIVIINDVFGLTVTQFERRYKACLERRKSQEQYILNLRYPDKTSNEYMKYLENSTDCNKGLLSWSENDFKGRRLYEHLVNTVGTEIDIRKRQQLFIIKDLIHNKTESVVTLISSGSLAEGIDLPGSDIDSMLVINEVDVIQDIKNIKHSKQRTTLLMEIDTDHPGFSRLKLIAGGDWENNYINYECFESSNKGLYLSVNNFVSNINKMMPQQVLSHDPLISDHARNMDLLPCLRSKYLPYNAIPWASRYRQQWPPNSTIDKIIKYGCLLVPIGPKDMPDYYVLWRLSFSAAENQLVHSFNFTQLLCYCLLKLTLKHIVDTNRHVEGLLCSYFLKTALFWVSEEIDIDTFQLSKLYFCFSLCLDKLKLWVKKCYCPNYFIPEYNMFRGRINLETNKTLINVLDNIKWDAIDGLIQNLCPHNDGTFLLSRTNSNYSSIRLDFLFYTTGGLRLMNDISKCLKALMFITELLIKYKDSTFIINVCKYYLAFISQNVAQLLPPPTTTNETYNIHRHYHKHLQNGIKTDAVSGWLLYASFYYVTGQYNVTLELTDYVLSRCSHDMLFIGRSTYSDEDFNNYRKDVHSSMTVNDKIRLAIVSNVLYLQKSSLTPRELQLEVNDDEMEIPPTVMSHCLRFLCCHHLGNISNRQQSLRDLYLAVKDKNVILTNTLSKSITILGVCYEISGDKDAAYQCYDHALQCDGFICLSAKARKSKLS